LSNFFFRLARKDDIPEELAWVSTHPDTKERAAEIIRQKKEYTYNSKPIIQLPWKDVQKFLSAGEEAEETLTTVTQDADTIAVEE
jgi:hypothetical protein